MTMVRGLLLPEAFVTGTAVVAPSEVLTKPVPQLHTKTKTPQRGHGADVVVGYNGPYRGW